MKKSTIAVGIAGAIVAIAAIGELTDPSASKSSITSRYSASSQTLDISSQYELYKELEEEPNEYSVEEWQPPPPANDEVPVQQQSQAVETQPPMQSVIVYVTDTGEKYHVSGCQYLQKSCHPIDLDKALTQGYTPCSKCGPPLP